MFAVKHDIDYLISKLYSGKVCRDRLYIRHALLLMAARPELRGGKSSAFYVALTEEMNSCGWCYSEKTIRTALSPALGRLRTAHPEWNIPCGTVTAVTALLELCGARDKGR